MPPESTTPSHNASHRYNVSAVLHSHSDGNDSVNSLRKGHLVPDDYAAYSSYLTVTICIGCSILILNMIAFAAAYYIKDKRTTKIVNNSEVAQTNSISSDLTASVHSNHQHSNINGQNKCPNDITNQQQQTHLPPPEFSDRVIYENNSTAHLATLPRGGCRPMMSPASTLTLSVTRGAPPPPRVPFSHSSEVQPLLHTQQKVTSFTIKHPNKSDRAMKEDDSEVRC